MYYWVVVMSEVLQKESFDVYRKEDNPVVSIRDMKVVYFHCT